MKDINVTYNLISLIDTLGLIQGVMFGLLLIIINHNKKRSSLFLGLFILAYGLELLPVILDDLNLTNNYPQLILLPFSFTWLLFPLFYVYVKQISILPNIKNRYIVLIPGLLMFLFNCIIFFQSVSLKKNIVNSNWYNFIDVIGLLFSLSIGVITYRFISKHSKALKNQYTATQFKELRWAKLFLLFGIILIIIVLIADILEFGYYFSLSISIINVALLYWISIRGILQENIQPLIQDNTTEVVNKGKNVSIIIKDETSEILFNKIDLYLVSQKDYINPHLTIMDVSGYVKAHPKKVSHAINSIANKNFKSYINSFRIEDAKVLIQHIDTNNLSIEGIGMEVGFQSKSAFYEAFKKETGTTPSVFKKQK